MKDRTDKYTADLVTPRRGRPPKPDALTDAQRSKRYRENLAAREESIDLVALWVSSLNELPLELLEEVVTRLAADLGRARMLELLQKPHRR